jgi:hypothetical protein
MTKRRECGANSHPAEKKAKFFWHVVRAPARKFVIAIDLMLKRAISQHSG